MSRQHFIGDLEDFDERMSDPGLLHGFNCDKSNKKGAKVDKA